MKRVIRIVLLLCLGSLFFVNIAWAAGQGISSDFTSYALPAHDLSLTYLGLLFDNVSTVVHGTGSSLMEKIFLVFNKGILIIAGVWLVYTIFNLFIQVALDGGFGAQQSKKFTLILLRMAIGFSLIIPNSTGYSGVQDIVMKVVVEGVKLADDTWAYALQYLQNGGILSPEAGGTPTVAAEATALNSRFFTGQSAYLVPILKSLICMNLSNMYYQQNPPPGVKRGTSPNYRVVVDRVTRMVEFPGYGNVANYRSGSAELPACGSAGPKAEAAGTENDQIAFNSLQQFVAELESAAQQMAAIIDKQSLSPMSDVRPWAAQSAYAAALDYIEAMRETLGTSTGTGFSTATGGPPVDAAVTKAQATLSALEKQISPGTEGYAIVLQQKQVVATLEAKAAAATSPDKYSFLGTATSPGVAERYGWFTAGSFYWDLSRYNDNLSKTGTLASTVPAPPSPPSITNPGLNVLIANATQPINSVTKQASVLFLGYAQSQGAGGSTAHTLATSAHYGFWGHEDGDAYEAGDANMYSPGLGISGWSGVVPEALAGLAQDIANYESSPTGSYRSEFYNPISFVMRLGADCLQAAGSIWTMGAINVGIAAGFAGACAAVNPGATVMQSLMSWLTPLYIGTATGLFVAGFMMAFYAPLYPYLLFMFGALSWMLYVLGAMVAVPLVCFGMTHPEGHDFLGRSEQALMLMLGVFLRPVLMVVGLLASTIMTYIAFAIVNFGFTQVLMEVFDGFATPGGTTLSLAPGHPVSVMNAIYGVVTGDASMRTAQGSAFSGHDITDFLLLPLLFVFYGVIVIEVVNQCFSLIHVLPDMVLRWIGGPVQQDRTEGMVQKVGQSTGSAAKQIGDLGGSATVGQGAAAGSASGDAAGLGVNVGKNLKRK